METVGGQAVIEGIMLRKGNMYSLAVRKENGKIVTEKHKIKDNCKGLLKFLKWPFFRGLYAMYEMMSIGMKTLIRSTDLAIESNNKEDKLSISELLFTILISFLFAIGFFVLLPYLFTNLLGFSEETRPILFNFVDAIIKMIIFVGYIKAISYMPDIKRVFQYHGAEHKIVHCYENKKKITYENIKPYSTIHPRCGSSFIMLTILVSIFVFSFVPLIISTIFPNFFSLGIIVSRIILATIRILFLPVVIMISYEVLKLAGMYESNMILKTINSPGLLLQKLTTSEPDKKQIEVAIASLNILLETKSKKSNNKKKPRKNISLKTKISKK